MNEVETESD